MEQLKKKLHIDEKFTRNTRPPKVFNHVKNNVPPVKGYNYMIDLLHLPTTKNNYKYLVVMVDLADNSFDIEPTTNKTADTVLKAFQSMIERKYVKLPKASVRSDYGSEFMGSFHKFLKEKNILHKIAMPSRHKQLANVENLNRTLGRLLVGYMNAQEIKTGKQYNDWDDIIDTIRKDLNTIRTIKLLPMKKYAEESLQNLPTYRFEPRFKVGDVVHYRLDYPENALGKKQPTENFREGDYRWSVPVRKIVKIIYMTDEPYYRYLLEGMDNVSYSAKELKRSYETESKWIVNQIIGKRTVNKEKQYKVWWRGYLKKDATWQTAKSLIEDGLQEYIDDFEDK